MVKTTNYRVLQCDYNTDFFIEIFFTFLNILNKQIHYQISFKH